MINKIDKGKETPTQVDDCSQEWKRECPCRPHTLDLTVSKTRPRKWTKSLKNGTSQN